MPESKKIKQKITKDMTESSSDMDIIAERYLDLWQDNVKYWATDPNALEKWLEETKQHIKSSGKNPP